MDSDQEMMPEPEPAGMDVDLDDPRQRRAWALGYVAAEIAVEPPADDVSIPVYAAEVVVAAAMVEAFVDTGTVPQ